MRGAAKQLVGVALAAVLVVGWAQPAGAAPFDMVPMQDFTTGEEITGTFSQLDRKEDGVATRVRTRDQAGHAYTLWYVIFNAPANCSGGICNEDDVFDFDGANPTFPFNQPQIEATRLSVVWSGAGAVSNAGGRLRLDGGLDEGDVTFDEGQVVIGLGAHGAMVPLGVVTGLEDAQAAEIHLVLQDHGVAHDDPEKLEMQLTRFMGACNTECVDPQFAVHLP